MPRVNHRAASFIDVTMHQAARRDALALHQAPVEEPDEREMSLNEFLWTLFGILVVLSVVLWAVKP